MQRTSSTVDAPPAAPGGALLAGTSRARDPARAVAEACAGLTGPDTAFALAFAPATLDRPALARELRAAFGAVPVHGCSTAGQITPRGYEQGALLVLAFRRRHFRCTALTIAPLRPFSARRVAAEAARLAGPRAARPQEGWQRLGIVLADGLSMCEDALVSALHLGLGEVPVFGGSAGDGLAFGETAVLVEGAFRDDAALLLLIETDLPFAGFGFDHFASTGVRMVVTAADPAAREVHEINGAPAAAEYARLLGCGSEELSPAVFAENPVLESRGDAHHARAVREVTPEGGLSFFSAVEDGLVLTLGRGREILSALEAGLDLRGPEGRPPDFVLGFDCILRRIEIEQKGLTDAVSQALRAHRVLGFNTYGEQHCGVHLNHTFVGVAFFPPREAS